MPTQLAPDADRETAHAYLAQAKAVLDFVIIHGEEGEECAFGAATKACGLGALDAAASLIHIADREFRAAS